MKTIEKRARLTEYTIEKLHAWYIREMRRIGVEPREKQWFQPAIVRAIETLNGELKKV